MGKDISVEILRYLDYNDGFYIEAGSNDGIVQSNTLTLEKEMDWHGILIEPSPNAYNECLKNRGNKNNIIIHGALVSDTYKGNTIMGDFYGHPMNSVGGKRLSQQQYANIEVPAYTITQILNYFNIDKVDFFSLDTEGYELEILRGLDFETWSPIYFLIEWNEGEDELFPFMESKGYDCIKNLSDFNIIDNPTWPKNHQDWLFKLRK
jgi:FkbM family methyltransferase